MNWEPSENYNWPISKGKYLMMGLIKDLHSQRCMGITKNRSQRWTAGHSPGKTESVGDESSMMKGGLLAQKTEGVTVEGCNCGKCDWRSQWTTRHKYLTKTWSSASVGATPRKLISSQRHAGLSIETIHAKCKMPRAVLKDSVIKYGHVLPQMVWPLFCKVSKSLTEFHAQKTPPHEVVDAKVPKSKGLPKQSGHRILISC